MTHFADVCYGTSRARTWWRKPHRMWGWYGWVRWQWSTDGSHVSGHRWPFRWMARIDAKRIGREWGAVPAPESVVTAQNVSGSDPVPWRM